MISVFPACIIVNSLIHVQLCDDYSIAIAEHVSISYIAQYTQARIEKGREETMLCAEKVKTDQPISIRKWAAIVFLRLNY